MKKLIFSQKDIDNADDLLVKTLRQIFFDEKITAEKFRGIIENFGIKNGLERSQISTMKSALLKACQLDIISWKLFLTLTNKILNLSLTGLKISTLNVVNLKRKEFEVTNIIAK